MIFINHTEDLGGKVIIVEIKGALNSETSADFEEYINQILGKKKLFLIIDALGLKYISSAGFGVFLYIQKKLIVSKGFFIVCSISQEIFQLYKLLGFDKIIKLAKDKDEALSIIKKHISLIENEVVEKPSADDKSDYSVPIDTKSSLNENPDEAPSDTTFDHPIILECTGCKGMIRVKKSGSYICPDCKTEFTVEPDQTVIF
ncbi:MAG: STAS domain-containing protein [Spirochaetes bacterium]|nr:STAS domain-containing protein [Spirochaetota bacterium]